MSVPTPDGLPAEHPSHVLVHLSDTHLTSRGVAYNGVVDADAALQRTLVRIRAALADGRSIDAVIASGDLTDSGDPDAYRRLRVALESLAVPVIFAAGNHDVRTAFHEHILDLPDVHAPVLQVHTVRGLRVIVLDSTVVGSGVGRLSPEHMDELRDELTGSAEHGTILVSAPRPAAAPVAPADLLRARTGIPGRAGRGSHGHRRPDRVGGPPSSGAVRDAGHRSSGGRRVDGDPHRPAGSARA